jgi:hypothetical protein
MTTSASTPLLTKLTNSALAMACELAWDQVTLSDLCTASDLTLGECAGASITKADVTAHLDSLVDQAMLACQSKVDRSQGIRDRVFDVLMGRFDAMEENRTAWTSILLAETGDFAANLARRARRIRTGAWALEASGVNTSDLRGASHAIGLARIIRLVEAAWVDDGADLTKTMARLDQELRKGEEWIERMASARSFLKR